MRRAKPKHQDVEPAELALRVGEQPLDVGEARHVGPGLADRGHFAFHAPERRLVDVADMDARALLRERGGGGHQRAPPPKGIFHGKLPVVGR